MSEAPALPTIDRDELGSQGAFLAQLDGRRLGAMSYSRASDALIVIDHTEIAEEARGTGLGRRLLDALVAWARDTDTKVIPLCPYAKSVFDKDASIRDVLK